MVINFLIGLIAGIFGGLVGLGGGVVMIPLMVGVLKMTQHPGPRDKSCSSCLHRHRRGDHLCDEGLSGLTASALLAVTAIFTAVSAPISPMHYPNGNSSDLSAAFSSLFLSSAA